MRNYDVYFEVFGKKIKTRLLAENEEQAKKQVLDNIVFHKVEKPIEEFNKCMDILDKTIDILKGV